VIQPADARLILREEELDAALELYLLAEASLWATVDAALDADSSGLGRGHFRIAFLLKRRPGVGVQELTRLTGLSKQGASRVLSDLEKKGFAAKVSGETDMRRRPAVLTPEGRAFEARISERLRAHLISAYREGGVDAAVGARRIWASIAGPRALRRGGDDV
jgi:DNA-binding MarR family transcriptional regulator